MKRFLTTIQLFLILFILQANELRAQNKCQFSIFEDQLNSIVGYFAYKDNKWPENEREMNAWCRDVQRDKTLTKNFILECLRGSAKTLGNVLVYSLANVSKLFCKNNREKSKYIAKGKCGNKAKKDTTKCWNNLGNIIHNSKKIPQNEKLPTLCCAFYLWKDCTMNGYRKAAPTCSEANIEHMEQHINKAAIDVLGLFCSDYEDSDRCDKFKKNLDIRKAPSKHKTFFPAVFEFFETL